MKSLSIRWRLAIWNAMELLFILSLMSFCFLYKIQQHLHARADLELTEEVRELEEELQHFPSRDELVRELNKRFSVHSHFFFELTDDRGETIFRSRFLTNLALPKPPNPDAMRGAQFSTIDLENLGSYRLLSMAIRDPESRPLMLRALGSQKALDNDFHSYIWMLLTLAPIVITASLVASYFWAARALLPITRINASAKRITAERLEDRLSVENPDDEIGELSITLNATFDRIARTVDAMKTFTSDAAHELRTPVAIMRAEAEIALRGSRTAQEYRSVVESTLLETKRLGATVQQLLTLSRLDSSENSLSIDEVPIAALAKDVAERLSLVAEQKRIKIVVENIPAGFVAGDEIAISQLLFNLIENAIKFSERGNSVTLSGWVEGTGIVIEISDTGIGIATEKIPKIFDRFYRADASRSESRGTGLGLAICQGIVDAHHGTIQVESKLGKGTVFRVFLPIFQADSAVTSEQLDRRKDVAIR